MQIQYVLCEKDYTTYSEPDETSEMKHQKNTANIHQHPPQRDSMHTTERQHGHHRQTAWTSQREKQRRKLSFQASDREQCQRTLTESTDTASTENRVRNVKQRTRYVPAASYCAQAMQRNTRRWESAIAQRALETRYPPSDRVANDTSSWRLGGWKKVSPW